MQIGTSGRPVCRFERANPQIIIGSGKVAFIFFTADQLCSRTQEVQGQAVIAPMKGGYSIFFQKIAMFLRKITTRKMRMLQEAVHLRPPAETSVTNRHLVGGVEMAASIVKNIIGMRCCLQVLLKKAVTRLKIMQRFLWIAEMAFYHADLVFDPVDEVRITGAFGIICGGQIIFQGLSIIAETKIPDNAAAQMCPSSPRFIFN